MLELLLDADVYAPEHLGRRNLLIGGSKILWMGTDVLRLPRELGATTTDLGGRRVIPGLIDGHAHITGGGGESGYASRVPAVPLSRFTSSGITTVVGLLGTDDLTRTTAQLVATARALCDEGMTAYCWTGGYHVPLTTLTGSARGDIVHVDRIVGVGELALSDHRSSQPTLDELLRIASEAHVAGLMSGKAGVVHLHMGDGPRGLELVRAALDASELPPRVFQPTHVNRRRALFDEACDLTTRGSTIDVTAFPVRDGEDAWSAPEAIERYLILGHDPSRITASSDGGGCLPVFDAEGHVAQMDVGDPGDLSRALTELLAAGVALETVLPVFTSNWARLLRLPAKGRIAALADADLCVLDDRHRIADVLCAGRWHVRERKPLVLGSFEAIPNEHTTP